ncbi:MAG: hypothetical protein ACYC4P_00050 [Thermoanaerobaculia bacterium]
MPSRASLLVPLLLLAAPAAAAEAPFRTELSIGFGRDAIATERPLVVLDGTPADGFDYSADEDARRLEVAATRWFGAVPDDGTTPLALRPYVARVSSVSARAALGGASRDSFGRASAQLATYEVWYAGDGSLREAELSGEWFVGRSLALRGGLEHGRDRETAASTSIESPSGRAEVATATTRAKVTTGTLGVALRLGEHEVSVSGAYDASDRSREDATVFTGSPPLFSRLTTDGVTRRGRLATRLLLLRRRLAVDVSGEYALATSSSDLDTVLSGPYAKGRAIGRRAALEATWFPTRRLAVGAGIEYETRDASSGSARALRASSEETTRTLGLAARWYATERVAVSFGVSRSEAETVSPPGGSTYQRIDETTTRLGLGAAVRF